MYILDGMVHDALSHHHSTGRRATGGRSFCASSPIREITMGADLYSQGMEADTSLRCIQFLLMFPFNFRHWIRRRVPWCWGREMFTWTRYIQVVGQYQAIPLGILMQGYMLSGPICSQLLCKPVWYDQLYVGNPNPSWHSWVAWPTVQVLGDTLSLATLRHGSICHLELLILWCHYGSTSGTKFQNPTH